MRVVSVSTFDSRWGAAIAACRLHEGLKRSGIDSRMIVQCKIGHDPDVSGPSGVIGAVNHACRLMLDQAPLWTYPRRQADPWSLQWFPNNIVRRIQALRPDIVHLHWIGQGFVPIKALARIKYPLVWTLHDMWALAGGCHYDRGCGRWQKDCGMCPQLVSNQENDLSRKIWQAKKSSWADLGIRFVTPSRWLADCVRKSPLLKDYSVQVIPYGLDTQAFVPLQKKEAREKMDLPLDRNLILFGAVRSTADPRKGYRYLRPALESIAAQRLKDRALLCIFGATEPKNRPDLGLETRYLGTLHDERRLSLAYSAADVFLAPSAQDNLPNTVLEALACGTPCVAFDIGGMPDLIDHKINGYLARPFEAEDLARGIGWVLDDKERHAMLCREARRKMKENFSLELQARRYSDLYRHILNSRNSDSAGG